MTDEEFEAFREAMDEQREEIYEQLAEDFGGDPEDYDATTRSVPDGGDRDR